MGVSDGVPPDEGGHDGKNGDYAPLFVRFARHCMEMHLAPACSREDSSSFDKAHALLTPIKVKYGDALSWEDLVMFAGEIAAMRVMGTMTSESGASK